MIWKNCLFPRRPTGQHSITQYSIHVCFLPFYFVFDMKMSFGRRSVRKVTFFLVTLDNGHRLHGLVDRPADQPEMFMPRAKKYPFDYLHWLYVHRQTTPYNLLSYANDTRVPVFHDYVNIILDPITSLFKINKNVLQLSCNILCTIPRYKHKYGCRIRLPTDAGDKCTYAGPTNTNIIKK